MSKSVAYIEKIIDDLEKVSTLGTLAKKLEQLDRSDLNKVKDYVFSTKNDQHGYGERIKLLISENKSVDYISGKKKVTDFEIFNGNIESYIGMAQIPIGLAGPITINGKDAKGNFLIPLATTEGALVASYGRGMKACRLSGGITSVCLVEGVQRSPYFKLEDVVKVGMFVKWIHENIDKFHEIIDKTSRYASLNEVNYNIEGNSVILTFEFNTGDAAGQNMVTICTDRICKYILGHCDIKPIEWYIESNYSGDKKATSLSFSNVRGRKVTAEIVVNKSIVEQVLKTTPKQIVKYWVASTLAVTQSGAIGAQGHVANGLTALFIACGQDVACISESSVGLTRMEETATGDLYVSVTLPSLIVGTVGGGTGLPTQKECLEILNCTGEGSARKFAEICCAVALAGELSIASAMAADHFTKAHEKLGR